MLVLMLWTSGSAHAAQSFDCVPVSAATEGHFEGDQDELPSSTDKGVAHHHAGCGGHQLAAPADGRTVLSEDGRSGPPHAYPSFALALAEPDQQLRPPIA